MKKKHLFILFILILINSAYGQQKTCKVQGVVRYFYNDYQGYKPDLGAQILIIPITTKNKVDTIIHYNTWLEYESLMNKKMYFLDLLESAPNLREVCYAHSGYKETDDEIISKNSMICIEDVAKIRNLNLAKYTILIDASGTYSIDIPFGKYYFLLISDNRERLSLLEISNRHHIIEVEINQTSKILSYDFEY